MTTAADLMPDVHAVFLARAAYVAALAICDAANIPHIAAETIWNATVEAGGASEEILNAQLSAHIAAYVDYIVKRDAAEAARLAWIAATGLLNSNVWGVINPTVADIENPI